MISLREVAPEDAGLEAHARWRGLKGGTAEENARAIRALFDGQRTAFRDIVLLNSGAALVVGGNAETIAEGVALAAEGDRLGPRLEACSKRAAVADARE